MVDGYFFLTPYEKHLPLFSPPLATNSINLYLDLLSYFPLSTPIFIVKSIISTVVTLVLL